MNVDGIDITGAMAALAFIASQPEFALAVVAERSALYDELTAHSAALMNALRPAEETDID